MDRHTDARPGDLEAVLEGMIRDACAVVVDNEDSRYGLTTARLMVAVRSAEKACLIAGGMGRQEAHMRAAQLWDGEDDGLSLARAYVEESDRRRSREDRF